MFEDPIVEEIHQVRERLLAESNSDVIELLRSYGKTRPADADHVFSVEEMRKRRSNVRRAESVRS
jgi:hypothetical protein